MGASEVLPPTKRGFGSFIHAEGGGGTNNFWVVLTRVLQVLTILEAQKVPTLSRGGG